MAKTVTIKGTGQLNGPVVINITIEMDDAQARSLVGSKRDEAIKALVAVHYPGVKIDPRRIGVNVQ